MNRLNQIDVEAAAADLATFLRNRTRLEGRSHRWFVMAVHGREFKWFIVPTPDGKADVETAKAAMVDMLKNKGWVAADVRFVSSSRHTA